jgi:predicted nucleic acid-binding protein
VTLFVDTAVLIYASGSDHPLREPCARFMRGIGRGEVNAVTSVEVVQEIIHRFLSIRQPEIGLRLARTTMDTFAPILPVTHALLRRVPDLAARYPTLQARDLVHLATCIHEGIAEIVSTDRGFDEVAEVRRIDPLAFAS